MILLVPVALGMAGELVPCDVCSGTGEASADAREHSARRCVRCGGGGQLVALTTEATAGEAAQAPPLR